LANAAAAKTLLPEGGAGDEPIEAPPAAAIAAASFAMALARKFS
jgi:hypothetical protein